MSREIIAARDGIALAEWLPDDQGPFDELTDDEFAPDPDDRERLHGVFGMRRFAVLDADGTVIGQVSRHATGYGRTAGCTAWNLGIVLLPAARGKGAGAAALRLLAEHLFATTAVDRLEAGTDRDNHAAQRALAKAGFIREGVIRGAQPRGGVRRDMVAYSLLRDDLPHDTDERIAVAEGDGIALVELLAGDRDWLDERDDDAFDVDPDPRPGRYHPETHRLGVLDRYTGELLGVASWHVVSHGHTAACEAWNLGLGLLPTARGRGAGAAATRLLAEYLFAVTDVDRLEASTDRDNVPAQRALAKAGFRPEGLIRGAQVREGRRRDMLAYSLLRTDLAAPPDADTDRRTVTRRDNIVLAEPGPGDREKFYVAGAGDFAVDTDNRPRLSGLSRSSLLSVLDAETGELLGGVSWHAVDYGGTTACEAWNIGIGLLPEARGRGIGTTAQRLLAEYLLETTELDRIEASTDVDNIAEQRALEKAGFRREGILRGAQLRGGIRRDLVHYGLVRGDF